MPKRTTLEMEPASGNVFADLGLPDTGEHLIKAGLIVKIDRTIRQRDLTQAAAAQLMSIDQPKVSAMLAGQFRGYSVERTARCIERMHAGLHHAIRDTSGRRGSPPSR
jgi:predicted XRE-type DNA-binding protein